MQSSETYSQPHSDVHKISFSFLKASIFRDETLISTRRPAIKKEPTQKHSSNLTLASSTNELSSSFPQEHSQSKKISFDEAHSQAKHCIYLIEDPLWKHVCTEVVNMMGSASVPKIWKCRLGSLSRQDTIIDLYCQTKEIAQFTQQYAFVIIGVLQQYFPALKELNIKSEAAALYQ